MGEAATAARPGRAFANLVNARPGELRALLLSAAYFFSLLFAWYILRPIRDEMGVAGGVENLAWLFTGTLVVTLIANPLFATLVAKYPRRVFIAAAYRFFAVNLLLFYVALRFAPDTSDVWIGRVFFVWSSMFNLFVVSVFWGFMVDTWRTEQGKRLFGFIGVGGTLGAIGGSAFTMSYAGVLGAMNLLLVSVVLLEVAVQLARAIGRGRRLEEAAEAAETHEPEPDQAIGGGILAGIVHTARSPYLLGICGYMLCMTLLATFLYFQQSDVAARTFADRAARVAFFARVELFVNLATVTIQLFFTGRIIRRLGVGPTLAIVPAVGSLGFLALGLWPTIGVLVALQVARRAGDFALSRPAREVLYTVISREDKYKAKSFIDTFVYRGGDQVGAWSFTLLAALGLGMTGISFVAVPIGIAWLVLALWLGRRQHAMAHDAAPHTPSSGRPAVAAAAAQP